MKDSADTTTQDLLPVPKRRGRPASGQAMTAAERKRKQRAALPGYTMNISMRDCSDTALHSAMQRALTNGDHTIAKPLCVEYLRRVRERRASG